MNERYKKIAEKAGFMLWGDEDWNPGDVVDWSARYDQELEEFAELIVKECAVVARAHTLGKYHGFVSDISEYNGIVYVEEAIKHHFGVEE